MIKAPPLRRGLALPSLSIGPLAEGPRRHWAAPSTRPEPAPPLRAGTAPQNHVRASVSRGVAGRLRRQRPGNGIARPGPARPHSGLTRLWHGPALVWHILTQVCTLALSVSALRGCGLDEVHAYLARLGIDVGSAPVCPGHKLARVRAQAGLQRSPTHLVWVWVWPTCGMALLSSSMTSRCQAQQQCCTNLGRH